MQDFECKLQCKKQRKVIHDILLILVLWFWVLQEGSSVERKPVGISFEGTVSNALGSWRVDDQKMEQVQ